MVTAPLCTKHVLHERVAMTQLDRRITSRKIAFTSVMCALSNVLGLFTIPIGLTSIHLIQFPIILTGLSLGPWAGGLVGFIGALTMAYRLTPPNPFIIPGNAILGILTGLFYLRLKKMRGSPIVPQVVSVIGAYILQSPYVYVTDVYLARIPSQIVLAVLLPSLLIEDLVSVLLSHLVLFRVNVAEALR